MKLRVDNFALIKHAEIDIDGITVIAGNNNSGKSTVGKVLFSIFSVLDNINHKIERQRYKIVVRTLISKLLQAGDEKDKKYVWELDGDFSNFMYSRQNKVIIDWDSFFLKYEKLLPKLKQAEVRQDIKYTIEQINSWHPSRLIMDAITPYFSACFNQQINSIATPDVPAKVLLKIKNKEISLSFEDNSVTEFKTEIELTNKAVFYNSPYVVDLMETHMLDNLPMRHLINMLRQCSVRMVDDSDLFEKSMLKDRLSEVVKKIDAVLPGRILKQRAGYGLARPEWKEPLFVKNLSTGLKAFVVLKMLLESNQLKDRDILILDEPEIHLHPMWQLIYAELIVLLQKEFDLSVVITTHSNFFLDAIETYTKKYQTYDQLHLYLSELKDGGVEMCEVTNSAEAIYSKMADALDVLDFERLSMN
ncbi:MAG: AAA family ATPase [Akkermansia sp.]|nr:AAA family ATPase [Akkermansia sp.]